MTWLDSAGFTTSGDSLVRIIRSAEFYGLIPDDYHWQEINHLLTQPVSQARTIALDLYLTDGFFAIRNHLKYGRVEKKELTKRSLALDQDAAAVLALRRVADGSPLRKALESQEPAAEEYLALKNELQRILALKLSDTTSQKKIKQLAVNMERWRWYTLGITNRYISVNVPAFTMKVIENDTVRVESKVIIGKPETPTPELESVVRSFTIYPYWHVPKSIVKEILPHIQEDTIYLKRHNYDVLDGNGRVVKNSSIDWLGYDGENFPYILRQREGSENTMGVIKFVFSNNYGVYLHDTNARRLFSKADRALSHGCIRVQKAVDLARYLIKNDYVVSPEDLDQYMMMQHRMEIKLIEPIPVYLQYFTCEMSKGKMVFYNDLYGKDAALIGVLYGGEAPVL